MRGFMASSEVQTKQPTGLVPKCGQCGLLKLCHSPKMPVSGKGKKGILIVGEAPGREEDAQGAPFVGMSGRLLELAVEKIGYNLRRDCWLTNALICRPPGNKIGNDNRIDYCRPNLLKTLRELQPEVIILLGAVAVRSLLAQLWKEDVGGVYRWVGWRIPCHKPNAWVCPTFHPAYILRAKRDQKVMKMHFEAHLEAAFKLKGRPWDSPPDYSRRIEACLDTTRAAHFLRAIAKRDEMVAFDYETDRLKPDNDNASIVCCSVCWNGKATVAYPWQGDAITATRELLRSPVRKVASNLKFEERWSMAKLGTKVRNWYWDTMLGGHILDNRKSIGSIKFQAFVLLGQTSWDDHVAPYLSSDSAMEKNRIKQVGLPDLLTYCGMDSLMEYLVAEKQMEAIGYAGT